MAQSSLIAVIGSYNPAREKELGLKNLAAAPQAAEDIGREFARQGFRIVIYSSLPHTLEVDVVRGYIGEKDKAAGPIQVLYSQQYGQPSFPEEKGNEDRFDFRPDFNPDWEFSFYQSLAQVDGVFIVGGGPSALIAGLVAIGHRKPIVACAAFGGSADKIWRALRVQTYPLREEDLALMGLNKVSPELAAKLVALLTKQQAEFARLVEVQLENEEKRVAARRLQELHENATINWHAIFSAILFIVAALAWPFVTFVPATSPFSALCLVLVTPMIAGASGATVRVVLDWATGVTRTFALSTYNQYILLRYAALGIVAGGLAGVSFVLAQIFASNYKPEDMATPLRKLVPFLIIIGFAAGLAAEVVLSNLRKSGVPTVEIPVSKTSK
ncbi:MAG: hypothetical protein ACJ731_07895 [Vicinamibacterales bacterium]